VIITHKLSWGDCLSHQIWPYIEIWEQLNNRLEKDINNKLDSLLQNIRYKHVKTLCEADKVYIFNS